ncbi:MAG: hypothetical protein LC640_07590 [Frankia sp.]|nr:hypothetical protein [Frankia sp.]
MVLTPGARVRALGTAAILGALPLSVYAGWGTPRAWALPALLIVVALSELAVVHLAFGRQRWTVSCTDGALGATLVLAPGAWTTVAVLLGVLVAQLVRRQPRVKVEFNVAQFAFATAAAAAMSHWLGGGLPGAVGGMGVFWLSNHALVAAAVSITSGRRLAELLWASAPLSALHTAGNTSVGILAAWLALNAPLGLVGLVVPMALLWTSYDQQTRRAAEARLFAELARGQEQATGQTIDVSARVVLTAAARLFGGADVELILVAAEGPVRYCGDEFGVTSRERVESSALDEPWVLRVLGAGRVCTSIDDGRPTCSAVLGDPDSPLAVLNARRPHGAAGFGRREVTLAEVLVGQAETWLSVADLSASRAAALERVEAAGEAARALGDIGADTAPSLVVLRESASRLARLASAPAGPEAVTEIVDELHAVERAVASLLGAIALAAEPDLASAAFAVPAGTASRPDPEWTTTGVLAAVE